jgi:DNA-binding transcriptional MocR family regulator
MKITLNRCSPQPIYLQIRDRLLHLIQTGALPPGERLPSIRNLADEVQVNKLTVIEAYGILEAEGLIHSRPSAGYFVNDRIQTIPLESNFAPAQDVIIQEQGCSSFSEQITASLQAIQRGNLIDFSSGFPQLSELENLQRIAKRALGRATGRSLFQYEFPQGQLLLRQQIASGLVQQGLDVTSENIIVTSGSQQALSLLMQHHIQPGDWVIVESPTYHGVLSVLEKLRAKVIGIPMTAAGMNLELLQQYLQSHQPKLIYTISTLHNPTGLTTSQEHRQHLMTLAEAYQCHVIEDNAYEGLSFMAAPAPIKALDRHDWVTYISTFSKTLIPGLRVGYMVVTGQHYQPILEQKLLHDLHSSTVSQAIVSEYLSSGLYRRHLVRLRANTLQSRNAMLQALETYFPADVSWTVPQGGFFLWVHLPDYVSIQAIRQEALAQNVLIASGSAFFPDQQGYPAMRLNFSRSPAEIEQGVAILGTLLKRQLYSNLKQLTPKQQLIVQRA